MAGIITQWYVDFTGSFSSNNTKAVFKNIYCILQNWKPIKVFEHILFNTLNGLPLWCQGGEQMKMI